MSRVFTSSRREMIRSLAAGSILLPGILSQLMAAEGSSGSNPLAPKSSHFPAKAKRVIFLYMSGGVSHLDTFDPKARLQAAHGQPSESKNPKSLKFLKSFYEFKRGGKSGAEVSDLFPHVRQCMDEICLIRSMNGDHNNHVEAALGIHTGSVTVKRPSVGSWVSYGLGTVNQNLPSFVVLAPFTPYGGSQAWGSDFLPACHQGFRVTPGEEPTPNLIRRGTSEEVEKLELGLLDKFNRRHLRTRQDDSRLAARIQSFETAFGMQHEMPETFDLTKETDATLRMYGVERGSAEGFGWQCLVARRMAERGVRFVELIDCGSNRNWDAHGDMRSHEPRAKNVDQAIAGLLMDLKSRGMLEDTLVVWTTEFGRTPVVDGLQGRNHQHAAYSSWLAGAGVRGGTVHGKTDDFGMSIEENGVHVHDFHASILHLMGLDHERLTFRHGNRDFRLTDVSGRVVKAILS